MQNMVDAVNKEAVAAASKLSADAARVLSKTITKFSQAVKDWRPQAEDDISLLDYNLVVSALINVADCQEEMVLLLEEIPEGGDKTSLSTVSGKIMQDWMDSQNSKVDKVRTVCWDKIEKIRLARWNRIRDQLHNNVVMLIEKADFLHFEIAVDTLTSERVSRIMYFVMSVLLEKFERGTEISSQNDNVVLDTQQYPESAEWLTPLQNL
jgi:hypothetical protein